MTCMITLRNLARLAMWSALVGLLVGFMLFGFDAPRRVGSAVTGWLVSVSDWGKPVPPPIPPAEEAVKTAVEQLVMSNELRTTEERRAKEVADLMGRLVAEPVAPPPVPCCSVCGQPACK